MSDLPCISCICPTRNRSDFLWQSLLYFRRQDYPNRELIIIDDSDSWTPDLVDCAPGVRYVWLSRPLTTGTKRNIACELAAGEIICQWDDDDWYGPQRLSRQVEPLLGGTAEMSAMRMSLLLDAHTGELWTCSEDTHRQCFKQDVHYGTLMYQASYWQNGIHYAPATIGEDVRFLHALLARGARLSRVVDPASFVYVLHSGNTTSNMRLVHGDGWTQVPIEQYLSESEQAFYASLAGGVAS